MNKNYFKKYSGAGNDFIFFDEKENPGLILSPDIIRKICDRRFGIGADGVIIVLDKPEVNFEMRYFNSDGSLGSLCGNGARCALKFASLSGRMPEGNANFLCNNENYYGEIKSGEDVEFHLHSPQKVKKEFKLKVFDQLIPVAFANTGSPHVVINIEDVLQEGSPCSNIEDFPVTLWGETIRYHNDFSPDGTNVNFIQIVDDLVRIRTYERGVEAETLACGTGSVASAIIAALNFNLASPVTLKTYGGDNLKVSFSRTKAGFTDVKLTGPAKQIFNGEIII